MGWVFSFLAVNWLLVVAAALRHSFETQLPASPSSSPKEG
jgi:hypothetical protein